MRKQYAVIRQAAARIAEAANGALQALREGRVKQEPAFTDRMLGGIERAMNGFEAKGIKWSAMTLTDRAPGAEEKEYGADFVGVLDVDLPSYKVKKGFLAQAKLIEPGGSMRGKDIEKLKDQCAKMLDISPDSFVFLYSQSKITVVPAIAVFASNSKTPYECYSRNISRFFEEHFESFIGDRAIYAPQIETLEEIRERLHSRSLLYLGAHI